MPNWCHNELVVEGSEGAVHRWVELAARQDPNEDPQPLLFSNFYPEPQYEGNQDWWDWRIRNWGTKWEPSFSEPLIGKDSPGAFSRSEGKATYRFDTAWGPPLHWLQKVAENYPELSFHITFGEPGMGFGGVWAFQQGELVRDDRGAAEEFLSPEQMWF